MLRALNEKRKSHLEEIKENYVVDHLYYEIPRECGTMKLWQNFEAILDV